MHLCSGVNAEGVAVGWGSCLGTLNENWESKAFCYLNKTIRVHEGSYRFLHSNSISRKWSALAFWGVGMMGRSIYFFFHLSRRYHELFSPITSRTALPGEV